MALCNWVKSCYNYTAVCKEMKAKGITVDDMKRAAIMYKGDSDSWDHNTISKIKKVAESAREDESNAMIWDRTGSVTTYFRTFELLHETK